MGEIEIKGGGRGMEGEQKEKKKREREGREMAGRKGGQEAEEEGEVNGEG